MRPPDVHSTKRTKERNQRSRDALDEETPRKHLTRTWEEWGAKASQIRTEGSSVLALEVIGCTYSILSNLRK